MKNSITFCSRSSLSPSRHAAVVDTHLSHKWILDRYQALSEPFYILAFRRSIHLFVHLFPRATAPTMTLRALLRAAVRAPLSGWARLAARRRATHSARSGPPNARHCSPLAVARFRRTSEGSLKLDGRGCAGCEGQVSQETTKTGRGNAWGRADDRRAPPCEQLAHELAAGQHGQLSQHRDPVHSWPQLAHRA